MSMFQINGKLNYCLTRYALGNGFERKMALDLNRWTQEYKEHVEANGFLEEYVFERSVCPESRTKSISLRKIIP